MPKRVGGQGAEKRTFGLKMRRLYRHMVLGLILLLASQAKGQIGAGDDSWFAPSDTFNRKRFNWSLGIAATTYSGFSIGLYNAWYRQYPQEGFHFFNDAGEWRNMDKVGHFYTAYFQGVLCYRGARWTGLDKDKSLWVGAICGGLFQTTIEVMDGFSSEWGFSVPDFVANAGGIGFYLAQQKLWDEQRIHIKVSSWPVDYPELTLSSAGGREMALADRVDDLYGTSFAERYLKDYNAQTYWASVNVASFLGPDTRWPRWLNIAVGYGAENLYGGYENTWESDGHRYALPADYDRYGQFYLGLDLDLSRIRTDNHLLGGLLQVFNIFKLPSPAVELNTRGEVTFHLFR